jgi:hypothetical protein
MSSFQIGALGFVLGVGFVMLIWGWWDHCERQRLRRLITDGFGVKYELCGSGPSGIMVSKNSYWVESLDWDAAFARFPSHRIQLEAERDAFLATGHPMFLDPCFDHAPSHPKEEK